MLILIKQFYRKILSGLKHYLNYSSNIYNIIGENNFHEIKGFCNNVQINLNGNCNKILIAKGSSLNNVLIYIKGNNHKIIIDEFCYFGGGELWIEDDNCSIVIKKGTTIEHAHLAVTEPNSKLEIGEDCMLAKHIEIRTGDSHSIIDLESGERINKAADVKLESHVWVGAHAKILKGVTIGHNSVIATNAVVVKSIPPYSIAAGLPAKVVKSNIDWKRERIYQ